MGDLQWTRPDLGLQPRVCRAVPCPTPGEPPGPFPGQGRPAAGEGRPLGSGWTSGSNPRQQPFPSDRFPSHFFFSAAGSTARIDGAAFPAPLSFPPFPLGDKCFFSHEGSYFHASLPTRAQAAHCDHPTLGVPRHHPFWASHHGPHPDFPQQGTATPVLPCPSAWHPLRLLL